MRGEKQARRYSLSCLKAIRLQLTGKDFQSITHTISGGLLPSHHRMIKHKTVAGLLIIAAQKH
jgi:hypothetical protein